MSLPPPTSGDSGEAFGFSRTDHRRVSEIVRRLERRPRDYEDPPSRLRPQRTGLTPAQAGAAGIPAGSISSPSSAPVTLLVPNPTTVGPLDGDEQVTAWNCYSSAIAANAFIWVTTVGSEWYVFAADCS